MDLRYTVFWKRNPFSLANALDVDSWGRGMAETEMIPTLLKQWCVTYRVEKAWSQFLEGGVTRTQLGLIGIFRHSSGDVGVHVHGHGHVALREV